MVVPLFGPHPFKVKIFNKAMNDIIHTSQTPSVMYNAWLVSDSL